MKRAFAQLERLNPAALLFGPVFQKDVRVAGRRRGTYWTRAIYTLILLAILTITYMGYSEDSTWGGPAAQLQQLQGLAPVIAMTTIWSQFGLLVFISPILTAGSICDEKRARTMSALMTTPLTSAQIVCSKLTSGLVQLLVLTLISTPILLAVRLFGGLDPQIVLAAALCVTSTAVLGAALGVLYSCWNKGTSTVVIMAILSMALIQGAPLVLVILLQARGIVPGQVPPFVVMTTCTPVVLGEASLRMFGQESFTSMTTTVVPWTWTLWRSALANAAYLLVMAGFVTMYATLALRKTMLVEASGAVRLSRKERKRLRRIEAAARQRAQATGDESGAQEETSDIAQAEYSAPSSQRMASGSREVSDRPVLWRELNRTGVSGSPISFTLRGFTLLAVGLLVAALIAAWQVSEMELKELDRAFTSTQTRDFREAIAMLIKYAFALGLLGVAVVRFRKGIQIKTTSLLLALVLVVTAFFFYLYISLGFVHSGVHVFLAIVLTIGSLILASVRTAAGITGEREARTWDALLATTLTPREILLGKYIGALKTQLVMPALLVGHLVLAAIFGAVHPIIIPIAALVIIGPIVFLSATGVLFSLVFKKSTVAGICNMGLALALWIGTWIVIGISTIFVGQYDNPLYELGTNVNIAMSPPAMVGFAAKANVLMNSYDYPGFFETKYENFVYSSPGQVMFLTIVCFVCGVYCTLAVGAIAIAESVFPHRSGRAS